MAFCASPFKSYKMEVKNLLNLQKL